MLFKNIYIFVGKISLLLLIWCAYWVYLCTQPETIFLVSNSGGARGNRILSVWKYLYISKFTFHFLMFSFNIIHSNSSLFLIFQPLSLLDFKFKSFQKRKKKTLAWWKRDYTKTFILIMHTINLTLLQRIDQNTKIGIWKKNIRSKTQALK